MSDFPSEAFLDALWTRRSIYALEQTSPISDTRILSIIKLALARVPSAFNSQSTRCVLLLRDEHRRFWDMAAEVISGKQRENGQHERAERTQGSLKRRGNAYGTVLFLESRPAWKAFADKSPDYAHLFPGWADHTSGMHQLAIWTAFAKEGLGANLQHYHYVEEVEHKAKEMFEIPSDWEMKAQLVFGAWDGERPPDKKQPDEKDNTPMAERVKAFGMEGQ